MNLHKSGSWVVYNKILDMEKLTIQNNACSSLLSVLENSVVWTNEVIILIVL